MVVPSAIQLHGRRVCPACANALPGHTWAESGPRSTVLTRLLRFLVSSFPRFPWVESVSWDRGSTLLQCNTMDRAAGMWSVACGGDGPNIWGERLEMCTAHTRRGVAAAAAFLHSLQQSRRWLARDLWSAAFTAAARESFVEFMYSRLYALAVPCRKTLLGIFALRLCLCLLGTALCCSATAVHVCDPRASPAQRGDAPSPAGRNSELCCTRRVAASVCGLDRRVPRRSSGIMQGNRR